MPFFGTTRENAAPLATKQKPREICYRFTEADFSTDVPGMPSPALVRDDG